ARRRGRVKVPILAASRRTALSVLAAARRRLPQHALVEVRLTILAIAVFYTIPPTLQTLTDVHASPYSRIGVVAAFLLINAGWLMAFSRGSYSAALDALVIVGLALFTLTITNRGLWVQALYMCAVLRSLYGEKASRVAVMTVLLILGCFGALFVTTGTHEVSAH